MGALRESFNINRKFVRNYHMEAFKGVLSKSMGNWSGISIWNPEGAPCKIKQNLVWKALGPFSFWKRTSFQKQLEIPYEIFDLTLFKINRKLAWRALGHFHMESSRNPFQNQSEICLESSASISIWNPWKIPLRIREKFVCGTPSSHKEAFRNFFRHQ